MSSICDIDFAALGVIDLDRKKPVLKSIEIGFRHP